MDVYKTEDEQLEQLKRWFRENGATLVVAVVVALAVAFGWRFWNERQASRSAAAAAQYESLLQAVENWSSGGDTAAAATVGTLAATLKEEHADTGYADYAAMLRARVAVAEQRYDDAATELQWVLDRNREPALAATARYRLARVLFAQQKLDEALALLESPPSASYAPFYSRLRGDILLTRGDSAGARDAYQRASELGGDAGLPPDQLLEIKLQDLKSAAAPAQES